MGAQGTDAGFVWCDGKLSPAGEARVSFLDRGLLHGYGLFETMRAEGGKVFFLGEHLGRMRRGMDVLMMSVHQELRDCLSKEPRQGSSEARDIALPGLEELARAGMREALGALMMSTRESRDSEGGEAAVVRLTLTRGDVLDAGPGRPKETPRLFVWARPTGPRPRKVTAATSRITRNETSPLTGVKALSYLELAQARREAEAAGADEAILLNTRGRLAEASAANVFLVKGQSLVTPSLSEGCLPGIVRSQVLKLAPGLGLEPKERAVGPDELARADEVFITNSRIGVVPLVELDGRPLGEDPRPVTARLAEAFRAAEVSSGEEP